MDTELAYSLSLELVNLAQIALSFFSNEMNLEDKVKKDIEFIGGWSQTIQAFLYDHEDHRTSHLLKDRFRQIRTFAYDIEDAIDEFNINVPEHIPGCKPTKPGKNDTQKLCTKIEHIREKIENFNKLDYLRIGKTKADLDYVTGLEIPLAHQSTLEDDVVGFEHETEEIISQLLSGEPQHSLISLVGPAGSGKTSLAYHVYESKRVQSHFDCRAWVPVSRPLNLQKVLQNILAQFWDGTDRPNLSDMDAIFGALNRLLHERSYVIVLDGVRSKEECDCIIDALPKKTRHGRIIVTSRISDIASSCLHTYELKGLPLEKASILFSRQAFQTSNGKCPPELEVWREKLVKKCEGLPLSLVAASTLLSNKRQNPYEWKNVHDELGAELSIIGGKILPSYKDLPSHLRSCFLYFSIFPEDYSVERERLKRLWIAERFVDERGSKKLEDVAEDNLNELVRRNLVHVTARDIEGRVKSCRLLHLVHQFIVYKAEEENFIKILAERRSQYSWDNARRLSVRTNTKLQNLEKTRSAFLFAEADCSFLRAFKLLKVLEMRGAPVKDFPEDIVKLTLLRYLSLRETNVSSVPRSIKHLTRLETLDLRQTLISWLPKAIRKLHRLRHLLVYRCEVKDSGRFNIVKGVEISSSLGISNLPSVTKSEGRRCGDVDRRVKKIENSIGFTGKFKWPEIQKLSLLKADAKILENLSNFTNLRKLGLVVLKRDDGRRICESIQNMKQLSTLEIRTETEEDYLDLEHVHGQLGFRDLQRLYLRGRLQELPRWIGALPSLIKISLTGSRLDESARLLLLLQALPNLMQLELVDAYCGNSFEFKADTFPKLKVLHIQQLDELSMLVLGKNAISKLEKLKISRCAKLDVQPSGISKLTHLKELQLEGMSEDFIGKVEKIIKERGMMTQIRISHSDALGSNQQFSSEKQS